MPEPALQESETVTRSPFEILGISPDAEWVVVEAAYRALARKYHPDTNPGVGAASLNERMQELNWARHELEADLAGWRRRSARSRGLGDRSFGAPSEQPGRWQRAEPESRRWQQEEPESRRWQPSPAGHGFAGSIIVEPRFIRLPGRRGTVGQFVANCDRLDGSALRCRFREGLVDVVRVASGPGGAAFRPVVLEDVYGGDGEPIIVNLDVVADGYEGARVVVSVETQTMRRGSARAGNPRRWSDTPSLIRWV